MTTDTMEMRELHPFDDTDVIKEAGWILDNNIDPNDRDKCKEAIGWHRGYTPRAFEAFVDWAIDTAKANAGGPRHRGFTRIGTVPRMPADTRTTKED
jgi:hypothetical protein